MAASAMPVVAFETGVDSEERSFTWTIKNFPVVLKDEALIAAQLLHFSAGDSVGMSSKWTCFLETKEVEGKTWVGVFNKVKERPTKALNSLFAQCLFLVKNKEGKILRRLDTGIKDMYSIGATGYGFCKFLDKNAEVPYLIDNNINIHVTFTIYAQLKPGSSVEELLEDFERKSTEKARKDVAILLDTPISCNDIKVVTGDKGEFMVQKGILSVRSPVFHRMLLADMAEVNDGRIEISDISSKTLPVLLRYLYTGELLPEWKDSEILVELTNAAAKYELSDLLEFLDDVLGKVCDCRNVGPLISLAHLLELNTAEEDLLSFVRKAGASSAANFIVIMNGVSGSEPVPAEKPSPATRSGRARRGRGPGKRSFEESEEGGSGKRKSE